MSGDTVIHVEGLWKRYGLPIGPALRRLVRPLRNGRAPDPEADGPWALRDVNLEVKRGETLGIIGRNGAGKSTLLKVLAGVTPPSRGRVDVRGRVFPMIELNAGLHMELTGRENVRLLGAIMGLSSMQTRNLLPAIEEFCQLGEYFEKPVRTYSSGMLARLGFAVAIHIDSDLMLVDEVFSVGDLKFQNKCLARMRQSLTEGRTILFVSHSLDILQFLASRILVLDQGKAVICADAGTSIKHYETSLFRTTVKETLGLGGRSRISSEDIVIKSARIVRPDMTPTDQIQSGERFGVELVIECLRPLRRPMFTIVIHNHAGIPCIWHISAEDGFQTESMNGLQRIVAWFEGANLESGAYHVNFAARIVDSYETLDRVFGLTGFQVLGGSPARGVLACRCTWEQQTLPPASVPIDSGAR
ncbi:MAG: ABC transporter ATP-binding protein [Chloroflexi bacterium]|nr:ABC transporter ATP-binding protein [Chloroflexota bacterium]